MILITFSTIGRGRKFSRTMVVRSGLLITPPLKPAMGVSIFSGSTSMAMPRGGRPLVMANLMPASRNLATDRMARSVRIFSCVTSVPSTSAMIRHTDLRLVALGMRYSLLLIIPEQAAVNEEGGTGDVARFIGGQKNGHRGDVLGFAEALKRNIFEQSF